MDVKRVLEKYGWKEGEGLGKDGKGKSEPIKVYQKRDNGGFGFKPGMDFTNHWWTTIFNNTASRISVSVTEDQVHVGLPKESLNKDTHHLKYNRFIKSKHTKENNHDKLTDVDQEPLKKKHKISCNSHNV